jgi:transposase
VRGSRIWRRVLGVGSARITEIREEGATVVFRVAPARRGGPRCGLCRRPCPRYDGPRRRRRWRTLDLCTTRAYIEAEVGRVSCSEHGVVVESVPWAAHGASFSKVFEEEVAWLAVECSKTAVAHLRRIAWRTVGAI